MGKFATAAKRVVFVIYLLCLHAALIYLLVDKYVINRTIVDEWQPDRAAVPAFEPSQIPTPEPETTPVPSSTPEDFPPPQPMPTGAKIIVPVQGVKPEQLVDTFTQARSEGRTHDAIDIMAPAGTPVLAAADGEIVKFFESEKGGITIYQISSDRKYFFYYAHLQRRADDISEKQFVKMGTVIGYVGDTGNAGPGNFHLHFAITAVTDPKRFWDGISVNPYEILRGTAELR
jgi:murein DD-endopeptidase MepM/ murein hydrolase activator NlpD